MFFDHTVNWVERCGGSEGPWGQWSGNADIVADLTRTCPQTLVGSYPTEFGSWAKTFVKVTWNGQQIFAITKVGGFFGAF